jgi:hypothetical protein
MSSPSATRTTAPSTEASEDAPVTHSSRDRVAVLAYRLWQERGCPDGSPEIDWHEAEQLIAEQPVALPPQNRR